MTRSRRKVPYAILLSGIKVWIVWTRYSAVWGSDLIFAAAFLAIVPIIVQDVSIVAGAHIRTNRIPAFVHAAAVVNRTFVDVGDEDGGEATLLHRIVGTKFDTHFIAF